MAYPIRDRYDLFVGNAWQPALANDVLDCVSPLTRRVLTVVPNAGAADVDAAVAAARQAQPAWGALPVRKRQQALERAAAAIENDARRLAWLETANTGKPWRESVANVGTAVDRLRYYAAAIRVLDGNANPVTDSILSLDLRCPLGVVGIIGAWNFPLNMFLGKVAPALAAGNAIVYKPAESTPITTLEIAAILGRHLPAGVVNIVTGTGAVTGGAIAAHRDIRKVSVTGSIRTGHHVVAGSAAAPKRLTLELGGKNAQIVFPDADLDRAAQGCLLGAFLNQGQVCTAGSRIFAHYTVAQDLKQRLVQLVPKLRIGDPFDEQTQLGTLISEQHLERVLNCVEEARRQGARVLCGGRRAHVAEYPNGCFLEPTLVEEVPAESRLAKEEVFGPVASFIEWRDEDELFDEVNGLEFGLAAGIWTQSLHRAHTAARTVQAGRIWVNCYNLFPSGAAFGGMKSSGFGREDAFETLLEFTEIKNVIMDTASSYRRFYE